MLFRIDRGIAPLVLTFLMSLSLTPTWASDTHFALAGAVRASNNPDSPCWEGMNPAGGWITDCAPPIDLHTWLTQSPPGPCSAVTLPTGHWVELLFGGTLADGHARAPCHGELDPNTDIIVYEKDAVQEKTLVFLTDGADQLFLLGEAYSSSKTSVPEPNCSGMVKIGFDLAGRNIPFVPRGIRVLSRGLGGGMPGFDLARIRARIRPYAYAACPFPADNQLLVPADTMLTWTPGHHAGGHALYITSRRTDFEGNIQPVRIYLPGEPLRYPTGSLPLGQTFYWRVDVLPNHADAMPIPGPIWSFTVTPYVILDDFEGYFDLSPGAFLYEWSCWSWRPITTLIHQFTPGHKGRLHLRLIYDDYGTDDSPLYHWYSSPLNVLAPSEVKSLEVSYRGDPNNQAVDQLRVCLKDINGKQVCVLNEDPTSHRQDEKWHLWRTPLTAFVDLDLTQIDSIGFDVNTSGRTTWNNLLGRFDFDDIRLCAYAEPVPEIPPGDIDKNQHLDWRDIQYLCQDWLMPRSLSITEPNQAITWFRFDESINRQFEGAFGSMTGTWIAPENEPLKLVPGVDVNALNFEADTAAVNIFPVSHLENLSQGITIAFWQFGTESLYDTDTLLSSAENYIQGGPRLAINLGCWEQPGRAIWRCGDPQDPNDELQQHHRYLTEWAGAWNHWTFTKNFQTGYLAIYHNGVLWAEAQGSSGPLVSLHTLSVGNGWLCGYDGRLDELRIYDYALSDREVAHLASWGTGNPVGPLPPTDLNHDQRVNLHDFTIMGRSWPTP